MKMQRLFSSFATIRALLGLLAGSLVRFVTEKMDRYPLQLVVGGWTTVAVTVGILVFGGPTWMAYVAITGMLIAEMTTLRVTRSTRINH